MNWLKCDYASNEVLGLRYVRRLEIKAGPEARTLRLSNKSGTWQHTTTYHEMPCTGWVIIAWCSGVASGPRCVGCYDSPEIAQAVLNGIFAAMEDRAASIDVPAIRARLDGHS